MKKFINIRSSDSSSTRPIQKKFYKVGTQFLTEPQWNAIESIVYNTKVNPHNYIIKFNDQIFPNLVCGTDRNEIDRDLKKMKNIFLRYL